MLSSNIPVKLLKAFAAGAGGSYRRAIPVASQIGVTDGAASLTDGFPPLNFVPVAGGGVPPFGEDMNGILYEISSWTLWQQLGGPVYFDPIFAASVNGYPKGAVLSSTTNGILWLCTADNNSTDPDGGSPANWTRLFPAKASRTEAIAGTNDTDFVTPYGLAGALAAAAIPSPPLSLTQNGYIGPIASFGGLVLQWGQVTVTSGVATPVSWPIAFPNTCFAAIAGGGSAAGQDNNVDFGFGTITPSGGSLQYHGGGTGNACFIAIGM